MRSNEQKPTKKEGHGILWATWYYWGHSHERIGVKWTPLYQSSSINSEVRFTLSPCNVAADSQQPAMRSS